MAPTTCTSGHSKTATPLLPRFPSKAAWWAPIRVVWPDSWKRLGPFTMAISDGDIHLRFQSNDVAFVSGLEIWTAEERPLRPPSTVRFTARSIWVVRP